jgi:putative hemolysin
MIGLAAAVAGLAMLASALLTAAHTAALQIGAPRLRTLEREGFRGADILARVRDIEPNVRASVRLLTRICNLTALGIIAVLSVETWHAAWPVFLTVIGGIVIIHVVADVLPHVLAAYRPIRLALVTAPLLLAVVRWTRPFTVPVTALEERIVGNGEDVTTEERELREMQAIGEREGVLEESESRLVERAFRLDELTAWDVMIPRVDIFAWRDSTELEEIIGSLSEVRYSRVPVYRGSIDEITGIVYVREAYERYIQGDREITLRELARPPFFVPGSMSLTQLLQDFQSKRIHLGIVADEFGGTDGLVTLEDVLEELVGEIHDELDLEEIDVVRVSESTIECDAGADVRELNEALGVDLPTAEHRSLNGYILEELGHVPPTGALFEPAGVRIEILEATETQVVRARLTKLEEAPEFVD